MSPLTCRAMRPWSSSHPSVVIHTTFMPRVQNVLKDQVETMQKDWVLDIFNLPDIHFPKEKLSNS